MSATSERDLVGAYDNPRRIRALTNYAQSIMKQGRGDDPQFYKRRSGTVPGLKKQYLREFNKLVREKCSNLDGSDFTKTVEGNIFGINLLDAEP